MIRVQVEKDMPTKPGYGLGLYSAGYHALSQMYILIAQAAQASLQQRWDEAVRHLARAVNIETSMGYIEPPRMTMTLHPCLASTLVLSGDFVAARKVAVAGLERFPQTAWSKKAERAIDLSASDEEDAIVRVAAHDACRLIFGSKNL